MKVIVINKQGHKFEFNSLMEATPYIRKDCRNNYSVKNGVRVYDDRIVKDTYFAVN